MSATAIFLSALSLASADYSNITPSDYPSWAVSQNKSAAVLIDVMVSPNGTPLKCNLISHIGDERLAQDICNVFMRKHFTPARMRNGVAAYAMGVEFLKFCVPGNPIGNQVCASAQPPSLILSANRLPNNAERADVVVVLSVDELGNVTDCGAGANERKLTLVTAVCNSREILHRELRNGPEGRPIPYVTSVKVRLTTDVAATPSLQ